MSLVSFVNFPLNPEIALLSLLCPFGLSSLLSELDSVQTGRKLSGLLG